MRLATRLVMCSLLATAVACGGAGSNAPGGDPASEVDGEWWLLEGHGPEGNIRTEKPSDATMVITGQQVEGVAVCNSYGGRVTIDDGAFNADGFSMTEMGCYPGWKMKSEDAFVAALVDGQSIERQRSRLTVRGPSSELRFKLHRPPPPPDLAGTRWKLNGLVSGRGPGGSVSSPTRAFLVLRPNGTMAGTTGCRGFDATWEAEGRQVRVEEFETEGSCDGGEEQDAHVVEVLSDGFEYEIREQAMTVYQPGGDLGLGYTTGLR